ncbi:uncharacterized protein LOC118934400 [Manis pentadactyla]|uniref:uncharacterized protein LOC118934400 n=1 Tax=Manis pentadactyla TaxID=143292 RepID=UPI00255CDEA1|nr:uncharacterized protein LOC118934400 [Manis pentadactyla]
MRVGLTTTTSHRPTWSLGVCSRRSGRREDGHEGRRPTKSQQVVTGKLCGPMLIDLRYRPPAEEGAVASGIPSAGEGTTAPRAVPHAQQQEARGCCAKSSRGKSSSQRGRRPGGSVALGVAWAASWGAEEPTASCPPALGPETRLLRTALRQEEKGGGHAPERRKDCIPVGQHMPGTHFIAVKVLLKKLEEAPRDHWNSGLKLSLKCPQPQVVGYPPASGYVRCCRSWGILDLAADKMSGLEAANQGSLRPQRSLHHYQGTRKKSVFGVCWLIDLCYPLLAEEGAVASRIPSAGAGTAAPRAVPHEQQWEPRRGGVKSCGVILSEIQFSPRAPARWLCGSLRCVGGTLGRRGANGIMPATTGARDASSPDGPPARGKGWRPRHQKGFLKNEKDNALLCAIEESRKRVRNKSRCRCVPL